jgi:G3E family GTPase
VSQTIEPADEDPSQPAGRLGVTLLTGFLGAGKTTLVNRLLARENGPRLAVVVNEFGDLGIDGDLVVGASERLVLLDGGCVCCTVRGDLAAALADLLAARERRLFGKRDFDGILIEASGLAAPGPIAQTLILDPNLAHKLYLESILCLVHGRNLPQQVAEFPEAAAQVAYADLLLLNHADQASTQELAETKRLLGELNALAEVHETRHAEIDPAVLESVQQRVRAPAPEPMQAAHVHASGVGSVSLASAMPLDLAALKLWLQFLASRRGHELFRIKGLVRCTGLSEAVVIQGMYEWLEIGPGTGPAPEESRLVLVGRHLDRAECARGWAAAGGRPQSCSSQAERL